MKGLSLGSDRPYPAGLFSAWGMVITSSSAFIFPVLYKKPSIFLYMGHQPWDFFFLNRFR